VFPTYEGNIAGSRKQEVGVKESDPEHETGDITCPRCGDPATWRATDSGGTQIEVECAACGRFSISPEQFEEAALENHDQKDRR
jgi:endogenous inhibitor of DNA gyrase (YacG/DUF329 family)